MGDGSGHGGRHWVSDGIVSGEMSCGFLGTLRRYYHLALSMRGCADN